jgi:hypothetical protein
MNIVHWEPSCSMRMDRHTWRSESSLFAIFRKRLSYKRPFLVRGKRCYHPTDDKCSRNCFVLLLTLCYALSVVGTGQFSSSLLWAGRSEDRCLIPRRHNRFACSSKPPENSETFYICSRVCAGDFFVGVQRFFLQVVISVVHNDGRLRKNGALPPQMGLPSCCELCCPQWRKVKKKWSSTPTDRSSFMLWTLLSTMAEC